MPAKPKKGKGKKGGGGGGDTKVRKYITEELDPWIASVVKDLKSLQKFVCDIEAKVYFPGSPEALAAQPHCNRLGGTIDTNPPPPPPPKFK